MRDFRFELKDGCFEAEVTGSVVDIAQAVISVIDAVHSSFAQKDPGAAAAIRYIVTQACVHPKTPLWAGNALGNDAVAIILETKKH